MKRTLLTLMMVMGGVLSTQAATYVWNGSVWIENSTQPADLQVYKIDQAYGENKGIIITSIPNGSTIDFGLHGKVGPVDGSGFFGSNGKQGYKFTGMLDLSKPQSGSNEVIGTYVLETRWLLTGADIYFRDGEKGPDYENSFFTDSNGGALTNVGMFIGDYIEGLPEFQASADTMNSYRFIATKYKSDGSSEAGIGVQYVRQITAAVPEPTTATLGLVALGALLMRRRRA